MESSGAQISDLGPGPKWHYLVALLIGLAITVVLVAMIAPIVYLYRHPDGSHYVEAARNFLAGKGFLVAAGLDKFPLATVPLSLEPPGYPMMIALGSKLLGVDPAWLAPRISWVSWALLPCALLFALRPVLKNWTIHTISIPVMIAPGIIENGWQALTEVPFLLVTIISIGLLIRGSWPRTSPSLLLMSGILGGLAYSLRNVGVALFVSIAATYVILMLLGHLRPAVAAHRMFWWGVGAALILIPLEIRNLAVFGTLQPYQMAPSQLGIVVNIRYYLLEMLTDITARRGLTNAFLWQGEFFFAIGTIALLSLAITRKSLVRLLPALPAEKKELFTLLIVNILAGSAIVILARSRFQWNETINQRQILQYDWIVFVIVALLVEQARPISRKAVAAISIAIAAIVGLRAAYAWGEIEMDRQEYIVARSAADLVGSAKVIPYSSALAMKYAIASDHELIRAIRALPADTILVSNYDDVIRMETGRVAHNIHPEDSCKAMTQFRERQSAAEVAMLIFPFGNILSSGCWDSLRQLPQNPLPTSVHRPYLVSLAGNAFPSSQDAASP